MGGAYDWCLSRCCCSRLSHRLRELAAVPQLLHASFYPICKAEMMLFARLGEVRLEISELKVLLKCQSFDGGPQLRGYSNDADTTCESGGNFPTVEPATDRGAVH